MPLPFDFEGKGVLELVVEEPFSSSSFLNPLQYKWNSKEGCFLDSEPTSVLDTIGSPSPPTSSSTLSSSLGGGAGGAGSTDTAGVAAVSGNPANCSNVGVESRCGGLELQPVPPALQIGGAPASAAEKCGMGLEDWESVLSESVDASPSQEQSILRWIMGDVEDSTMGLNKLLQTGGPADFDFGGSFSAVDPVGLDPVSGGCGNLIGATSGFPQTPHKFNGEKLGLSPNLSPLPNYKLPNPPNPIFSQLPSNYMHISLSPAAVNQPPEFSDVKPQIFNPQLLINPHQAQHAQNPAFFLPLSYSQQDHHLVPTQPAKRHHPGGLDLNPPIPQGISQQMQWLPQYLQQRPAVGAKPKVAADEARHHLPPPQQHHLQQQQAIIDQLYKAAELVQSGHLVLAQGILARLNHQLALTSKPFHRAAFLCKEALQLLLHQNNAAAGSAASSPFNLVLKIGAYKSFSEISPLLQFANFTCNQALLEALEGFDRIHVIDFDIGYGGQWASLMQELALRSGGAPSLKITAFASPSTHDQLELGLTRENLNHFAGEINMALEFEILSLESLNSASWSLPLHVSDNEAVAVNLPIGSVSNYQLSLPVILLFVKQLSPKIVVSVDRGCDRTDLPFPNHVIHAFQSYSNLLESLDAVNVNPEALQKVERFLLQPAIERIITGRYRSPEKTPHWRTQFLSSGFCPYTFSNFTESLAECVVKRTPVRGFHVEKRNSSLVLCWQSKELISASAWKC